MSAEEPRPAPARRVKMRYVAAAAAVLAVVAVTAGALVGQARAGEHPGAAPSPSPTATSTETSAPTEEPAPAQARPTPASSAAPALIAALPANCEAIYSRAMLQTLRASGHALDDPASELAATADADIAALLSPQPALSCHWGGAPKKDGLTTTVASIDAATSATVLRALKDANYGCQKQGIGTRCSSTVRGGGENHYIDGTRWIATQWRGFGPNGYTDDIIRTLTVQR